MMTHLKPRGDILKRDKLFNMIEVHHDNEDNEHIRVSGYGSGRLCITPSSSNSVYLTIEKRW
ncbi:MAG: hypothetical protein ACREHG_06380 [Candidatus Saccharimonadales bacterium]